VIDREPNRFIRWIKAIHIHEKGQHITNQDEGEAIPLSHAYNLFLNTAITSCIKIRNKNQYQLLLTKASDRSRKTKVLTTIFKSIPEKTIKQHTVYTYRVPAVPVLNRHTKSSPV